MRRLKLREGGVSVNDAHRIMLVASGASQCERRHCDAPTSQLCLRHPATEPRTHLPQGIAIRDSGVNHGLDERVQHL